MAVDWRKRSPLGAWAAPAPGRGDIGSRRAIGGRLGQARGRHRADGRGRRPREPLRRDRPVHRRDLRVLRRRPQTHGRRLQSVGGVEYPYGIGRLEVTVEQWVAFLNTADPDRPRSTRSLRRRPRAAAWPKYGQINSRSSAAKGAHYSVAYPEWADKPYAFANFLRAARFVNSLYNGRLLSKSAERRRRRRTSRYKVRLSPEDRARDVRPRRQQRDGATRATGPASSSRARTSGSRPPTTTRPAAARYSYWKYPTNPGVFGDGTATAPSPTTLDPTTGDVTNAATQPLATYHASGVAAPTWCPAAVQPQSDCSTVNPFGLDPTTYAEVYQGSVGTVGPGQDHLAVGHPRPGRQRRRVDRHDHPAPVGQQRRRVWRRLHGGIANAPAYQLWLSAVGLQPQDNRSSSAPTRGLASGSA